MHLYHISFYFNNIDKYIYIYIFFFSLLLTSRIIIHFHVKDKNGNEIEKIGSVVKPCYFCSEGFVINDKFDTSLL